MVTLGAAAKQLGVSKPTLSKAISRGALSATRRDDGSFAIDPAELVRWWESTRHRFQARPVTDCQGSTPSEGLATAAGNEVDDRQRQPPGNGDAEVAARLAALEAEVRGLRELVAEVKASRETAQATADQWRAQAERITFALPAPKPAGEGELPAARPRRWWQRRAG